MIVKTCDVCKKEVSELRVLKDYYKLEKVSQVCQGCLEEIDELIISIERAQSIQRDNFIKRFIKKSIK